MKKFGVFLIILGLLVAGAGFGVKYVVENHEDIKELNAYLTVFGQDELTPEFVMKLLNGDIKVMGQSIDAEEIVNEVAAEDADKIMIGMTLYAYSPLMMKGGLAAAALGLILAIFGPSKKKNTRGGYAYGA